MFYNKEMPDIFSIHFGHLSFRTPNSKLQQVLKLSVKSGNQGMRTASFSIIGTKCVTLLPKYFWHSFYFMFLVKVPITPIRVIHMRILYLLHGQLPHKLNYFLILEIIQHLMPKISKLQSNHYKSLAALEGNKIYSFIECNEIYC